MPKINVYLPDDLAAAVRAAGFPVSPVCQKALADAVRSVNDARKLISAIRDPHFDPARHAALSSRIQSRMTRRLGQAFGLARQAGAAQASAAQVGTAQLLLGVLDQGDNLGIRLLQALDVDPDELRAGLLRAGPDAAADDRDEAADPQDETAGTRSETLSARDKAADPRDETADPQDETAGAQHETAGAADSFSLTRQAWRAIATTVEASISFGHNYLGCEHLVLALITEADSAAGRAARQSGAEPAAARKALSSLVAGFASGRQATLQDGAEAISEIRHRLDTLESRIAALPALSE